MHAAGAGGGKNKRYGKRFFLVNHLSPDDGNVYKKICIRLAVMRIASLEYLKSLPIAELCEILEEMKKARGGGSGIKKL